jgi:hypothetical protein
VDGLCALVILAVLVEGPTLYAIARDRLK